MPPPAQSADMVLGACPDEVSKLKSFERSSLARLIQNSEAGCQVCNLLYRALEGFHGPFIRKYADDIQFSLFRSIDHSLRVDIFLDRCKGVLNQCRNKSVTETWFQAELVYERKDCGLGHFGSVYGDLSPIGGPYAPLGILPGRKLPEYPDESARLMNDWIRQCIKTHPCCHTDEHSQLPTRVLDVGTSQDCLVRLHLSSDEQASYAALSHRWGKENLLKTTKDTLEARKQCINWSDLSKTFQDAIAVSRLLGLRYLWIDSLCIVQDDLADWEIESSKMATIYQNSYVTISANNSFGALLGERAKRENYSSQLEISVAGGTLLNITTRSPIDHNNFFAGSLEGAIAGFDDDYPLSKRAWCFQERLLATRVLHFMDEEIVFECKTSCECECGSINHKQYSTPLKKLYNGIIQETFTATSFAPGEWEGWQTIISPYIRKDLTDPRDVLPALAGVASRVQCDKLGRYFAGLWEHRLAEGLFWYAEFVSSRHPVVESAPSFSWAALAGTSRVGDLMWHWWYPDDKVEQRFKVVEAYCSITGVSHYGKVAAAFVKLRGRVVLVTLKAGRRSVPFHAIIRASGCERQVRAFLDRSQVSELVIPTTFVCFLGYSWTRIQNTSPNITQSVSALLLKPLTADRYQRVGCIPNMDNNPSLFKDAEEQSVTIF